MACVPGTRRYQLARGSGSELQLDERMKSTGSLTKGTNPRGAYYAAAQTQPPAAKGQFFGDVVCLPPYISSLSFFFFFFFSLPFSVGPWGA